MSIADKILQAKADYDAVYDAGKQAEQATFWDVLQAKGERVNYMYAFAYDRFSDANYNPKYPINTKSGTTPSRYMFAQSTGITDTKVPIYANGGDVNYTFQGATGLETIRELKLLETQSFTSTFASCSGLKNITITGTIGKDISFKDCSKLTPQSVESIVTHLKNYSGTSSEFTYTVTIPGSCWTALEAYSSAPDGGTWTDYIRSIGWNK